MTQREWPRLEVVRDPEPDTDDETEPTNAELVPVAETETALEGPVLPGAYDRAPRKILPAHMDSPQIFIRYVRGQAHYGSTVAAFHLTRIPKYWGKLLLYSPIGLGKAAAWWFRWCFDTETAAFMRGLHNDQAPQYDRLSARRDFRTYIRLAVTGVLLIALAAFVSIGHDALKPAAFWALVALALTPFGLYAIAGTGRAIVEHTKFEQQPLTYDLLVNALNVLGIPQLTKSIKDFGPQQAIILRSPIGYQGQGWRCEFDLPAGVPASEVVAQRDRLASGLTRPVSAVWPSTRPDVSANRLSLYVADKPLSQMKARPWPLLSTGQTSVFQPIPLGQDATGLPVNLTLIFTNGICGAQPRMGKTFSMRLIALGAALDPTCQLDIYNLKDGSDWSPFKQVAHRYRSGQDDEDFEYVLAGLREMKADMKRRYGVINDIESRNSALVPEGKVTPELAARPELGLHPRLLMIDEVRVLFTDKRYKDEAIALMVDLCSLGPAAGIMAYAATQSVKKETVPPLISNMAIVRLCFRVQTYGESNLILGNLSGAGYNAATFNDTEKGIGYLVGGEGEAPTVVRFAEVNGPQARAITTRARAVRKTRGLLTGYAAEDDLDVEDTATPPLQHIADVWPADRPSLGYHEIAGLLEASQPVVYEGWTYRQVKDTCNTAGLTELSGVKHQNEPKGRGIRRADLFKMLSDVYAQPELESAEEGE